MKKAKVAIIRGPGLSKWEMQIYEPLAAWFNLLAVGSKKPVNDISGITFPTTQLYCPGQCLTQIPKAMSLMFRALGDTQWLLGFSKAISGFDLLHGVELGNGYTVQAVRAKKEGKVKAVTLTVYENIPFLLDQYPARRKLKKEIVAGADHFLAANEVARQALLVEGVDEERISIIPQSVDTRKFTPRKSGDKLTKLRQQFGIKKGDFVILSVGRMVWEKGWYDIVAAAAKVKRETKKRVKFLLVGGGTEKRSLELLAKREGLDNVIFTGTLPYREMADVFKLADVFVLASVPTPFWQEQFGGVLIEAMAAGLPIVGTLSGGIKETVGEAGGIFVQPRDFSALAQAILKFLEKPGLGRQIGLKNRQAAVKKYDNQVVAKKIKVIWEKVLGIVS